MGEIFAKMPEKDKATQLKKVGRDRDEAHTRSMGSSSST